MILSVTSTFSCKLALPIFDIKLANLVYKHANVSKNVIGLVFSHNKFCP